MARLVTVRLGLRARVTLAFALGALLLSVLLSVATYALTRANLLRQREEVAQSQEWMAAFWPADQASGAAEGAGLMSRAAAATLVRMSALQRLLSGRRPDQRRALVATAFGLPTRTCCPPA